MPSPHLKGLRMKIADQAECGNVSSCRAPRWDPRPIVLGRAPSASPTRVEYRWRRLKHRLKKVAATQQVASRAPEIRPAQGYSANSVAEMLAASQAPLR